MRILEILFLVMFFIGLHNIDNAYNMKIVEVITGIKLYDCSLFFCSLSEKVYALGVGMVFVSFLGLLLMKNKNEVM